MFLRMPILSMEICYFRLLVNVDMLQQALREKEREENKGKGYNNGLRGLLKNQLGTETKP